jgi:exonuclease III
MCHKVGEKLQSKTIRFGTLNVRGILTESKQQQLADDMQKYRLQTMAIQETHVDSDGVMEITSSNNKAKYNLYHVGEQNNKHHGVGIITDQSISPQFQKISERTCKMTTKIDVGDNKSRDLVFISTYAPTLPNSEANPDMRDKYYEDLETTINNTPNRSLLVVGGDFNAQTGSAWPEYKGTIGKFGKGEVNSNGEHLLEMAKRQEMVLSNTQFYHKHAHRTTWVCPQRKNEHKDKYGQIRRNPYRNQIDYILLKTQHRQLIQDARSYSGINTSTDHRLVITIVNLTWYKVYSKKENVQGYNTQLLKDKQTKESYTKAVIDNYEKNTKTTENPTAQQQWDNIATSCLAAAKENLKTEKTEKAKENTLIAELSNKQKKIRNDINATKDKTLSKELKTKRNRILKEIHKLVEAEKIKKIEDQVDEIERNKNDSTRMYQAVRHLQQSKPKKKLVVDGEHGLVTKAKEQVEIITKHFREVFHIDTEKEMPEIKPTEMKKPFTEEEVSKAVKSLKNNKSAGCDQLKAELVKHGPPTIHQGIAILLNHMAKTGDYPKEIKTGILVPLPKPGKPQGPPKNLRPIILLSIIRKILAIIMIRRTADKLNSRIPISQAAYRSGRGTTEQVFTLKTLAEKAITSTNYEINILLLDMSKAFDTIQRDVLMEDLKEVLDDDELHMFHLLLKDVQIQVRVDKELGDTINTNIGAPQGDTASAVIFTFYLAKSLQEQREPDEQEHNYAIPRETLKDNLPSHLADHSYASPSHCVDIDQQYADDIGWITTNPGKTTKIKQTIPQKLKKRNLTINEEKTEEYKVKRGGPTDWRKCKYLGSLLGTEEDINRRKGLTIGTFNQLKRFLQSKRASMITKMRIFNAYVCSIFLYNSELWTLTSALEHKIDTFQRTLLRRTINVTKLDKITNKDLYSRTNSEPWSRTIKRRRLNWLGHLMRLPEDTPARKALTEYDRPTTRPVGRPKPTWVAYIRREIQKINPHMNSDLLVTLTNDRKAWRSWVARAMAT